MIMVAVNFPSPVSLVLFWAFSTNIRLIILTAIS